MGVFIINRLIMGVIVLFLVTIMTFLLLHIMPGDPVIIMFGGDTTEKEVEILQKELWLDRPIIIQYGHWLGNAIKGDFGKSITFRADVIDLITTRLPITLHLALISIVLMITLGITTGLICAIRRGSVLDNIMSAAANTGVAIPQFWLGILGIYFLSFQLGLLPIQGYTSPFDDFVKSTRQIIMPVFCLMLPGLAILTRQTRSSMLEVVKQDYIRTAWAKGLQERIIIIRHALKNALIPIVTLFGVHLRVVFGGSVIVETIFNIPGLGRLFVAAVMNKDFITVQACTLWISLIVYVANFLVDISYGWIDPRIRYTK